MSSFFRLLLFLILVFLCIGAMAGVWAMVSVPGMAAAQFGSPGPGLSRTQRVIYAARLLMQEKSLLSPMDRNGQPHEFDVTLGESVNSIATRLEEERIISNADAFRTYLIYAGLDTGVRAGKYQLSAAMNAVEIAHTFQNAIPNEVQFNILAGWRAEEIADALPTSGLSITRADFLEVINHPPANLIPAGFPELTSLEGFLMPGEYQVRRNISAEDLVALFLKRFDESVTLEMREGFTQHGLNLQQAVTLASIVQREAMVTDEQPVIASVFYNRLADGMKLDSDPTVQYALGYIASDQSWWKNPLTRDDLQVNSRYNTYVYPGLPPGPISNPGMDVLTAVAHPDQTRYFYFRAKCDGSGRHAFSTTYQEHLLNACP